AGALPLSYTRPGSCPGPQTSRPLRHTAFRLAVRHRAPLPLGTCPDACPRRAPGGGGRIRTFELSRGQIYSLLPLTDLPPLGSFDKAPGRLSARRSGGGDVRFLKGLVNNM